MKTTAPTNAEPGQQTASEQIRSRPAQKQAVKPSGHFTQLAAMVNASPQIETLEQLKGVAQQSRHVQRLMNLTGEINSGRPQWSGISVGQKVVQRELYESGEFTEPEPEVTLDYETLKENDEWHFLQQGLKMFTSAAGSILSEIERLPNLVLTLSTSAEIDSIGKTTLKLVSPEGKVYTSEAGQHNSATVQQWSQWLGNPKTRVAALVQINPKRIANAAQVAHTLNHEVFLHAVEILDEIKRLKSIKGDQERETFALQNIRNPDKDHEDFVFGRRKDLITHQARMISNALRDNPVGAQQLVDDYRRDWTDRREEMIKALAGNLKYGNEKELKTIATGNIKALSSIPEAQEEVEVMRKIIGIIDYSFDVHVANVREKYEINLSPPIKERERGKPVDISALPK